LERKKKRLLKARKTGNGKAGGGIHLQVGDFSSSPWKSGETSVRVIK